MAVFAPVFFCSHTKNQVNHNDDDSRTAIRERKVLELLSHAVAVPRSLFCLTYHGVKNSINQTFPSPTLDVYSFDVMSIGRKLNESLSPPPVVVDAPGDDEEEDTTTLEWVVVEDSRIAKLIKTIILERPILLLLIPRTRNLLIILVGVRWR